MDLNFESIFIHRKNIVNGVIFDISSLVISTNFQVWILKNKIYFCFSLKMQFSFRLSALMHWISRCTDIKYSFSFSINFEVFEGGKRNSLEHNEYRSEIENFETLNLWTKPCVRAARRGFQCKNLLPTVWNFKIIFVSLFWWYIRIKNNGKAKNYNYYHHYYNSKVNEPNIQIQKHKMFAIELKLLKN